MRKRWILVAAIVAAVATAGAEVLADDFGNSPLAATPIVVGGAPLEGCIETAGDADYFLWSAVAGRTYRLLTSHLSSGMDTLLYLFDSDGSSILVVDDDSGTGGASQITFTAPRDSVFFAMVRHANATAGIGCYGISIAMLQVDDHGNDPLSATPLTVGAAARSGFLEQASDRDVFLFLAERGYAYSLRVARTSGTGVLDVRLLAEDGAREIASSSAGSDPVEIEWSAPSAGARFVEVRGAGGEETLGYDVRVTQAGYGDDFGSSAAAADDLGALGPVVSGHVEVAEDEDWFRFEARPNGEYHITLSPADGAVLRATLLGADGVLLVDRTAGSVGATVSIDWTAPNEGTYYVRITAVSGAGAYALHLKTTLALELLGRFNPQGYSLDVRAANGLAYLVVGTKGLLVVDVSDPSRPVEIGSNSTRGYAQSVAVSGNVAYVANRGDGLTMLQVSDPMRPVEVGHIDTSGSAQAVALRGQLAIVADQRGGLQLIDVSKPSAPSLVKNVETSGFAQSVWVDGTLAYVAAGDAGLEIVDLAAPSAAASVARLSLQGEANDVVVSNGVAFVAAGYRGVRIVDVSTPSSPAEIGFISTAGEAVGLAVRSSAVYVTEGTGGLSVYDVSNPADPTRLAQIATPGEALRVALDGNFAYVACREAGLAVIRLLP